eukprot:54062-Eustigmatos_ZCMA.PRE.1
MEGRHPWKGLRFCPATLCCAGEKEHVGVRAARRVYTSVRSCPPHTEEALLLRGSRDLACWLLDARLRGRPTPTPQEVR